MQILKWVVGLLVLGAVGSFLGYRYWHSQKQERERKAQAEKVVSQLTARHNAVVDWEEKLKQLQGSRPSRRILTIELEKLWMGDRPVRSLGALMDVSSAANGMCEVVVMCSSDVDTELRMRLRASKAVIDEFLQNHPNALGGGITGNGIVVVAKISSIKASEGIVHTKTGHGELLEIAYIGDLALLGRNRMDVSLPNNQPEYDPPDRP